MTEEQLKDAVAELIRDLPAKIWLTRAVGHRLDFLWSVGEPQQAPSVTLARRGHYYIVGQQVPENLKPRLLSAFDKFCSSEEARQADASTRPLRFVRTA